MAETYSTWTRGSVLPIHAMPWLHTVAWIALIIALMISVHTTTLMLSEQRIGGATRAAVQRFANGVVITLIIIAAVLGALQVGHLTALALAPSISERILLCVGGLLAGIIPAMLTGSHVTGMPGKQYRSRYAPQTPRHLRFVIGLALVGMLWDVLPVVTLRGIYVSLGTQLGKIQPWLEFMDQYRLAALWITIGLLMSAIVVRLNQRAIMRILVADQRCPWCGYNLGYEAARCPECGGVSIEKMSAN